MEQQAGMVTLIEWACTMVFESRDLWPELSKDLPAVIPRPKFLDVANVGPDHCTTPFSSPIFRMVNMRALV